MSLLDPVDAHDDALLGHVHPPGWVNPRPAARYNLVVIGGGTAGLVAAIGAAGLGARVALVERGMMGGDCLNTGCVPSKALLASARAAHAARGAGRFGVRVEQVTVDFAAVMGRMRRLRAAIAPHDSFQRVRDAGVDAFLGTARFTGRDTVQVGDATLRFAKAVICTGARPTLPDIPGLAAAGPLTSDTVFQLTALPARLLVVGGGPVGCELAQAFARFGSRVTLVEAAARLLPGEDEAAGAVVQRALAADGVTVRAAASVDRIRDGAAHLGPDRVSFDAVLVATGRRPAIAALALASAGVAVDARGVRVDAQLRTTNPHVYASGDAAGLWQLTHAAEATSRLVLQNALFLRRLSHHDLVVPRAVYTDPEVAAVGAASGPHTIRVDLADIDRAKLDGETDGFAALHVDDRGRVLGGTLVARHAGELVGQLTLAVQNKLTLGDLAQTIQPYPTTADLLKHAGNAWMRRKLTPTAGRVLRGFLQARR
jgi:pyruvate/2-oxoglutarate dehydrogenase complex dihydrolipoamide dehydrogenase (E3) component